MAWWPWGWPWISLGTIHVNGMAQGGTGAGGGGGGINLISSAGDFANSVVWNSFIISATGLSQGAGAGSVGTAQAAPSQTRTVQCQPRVKQAGPVYTFRFEGGERKRRRK